MNIYKILSYGAKLKSRRVKLFAIWLMHILRRRYIGIFFDPVFACNFRCKMCYFSEQEKRSHYGGLLSQKEIEQMAAALFHRALKLQIGCGAEPTLYKDLTAIIRLGKKYKIPYISITTNGSLLDKENITHMLEAGLDELTLSTHGFTAENYENLMVQGNFAKFINLLDTLKDLKTKYPRFRVRINFTVNNQNLQDLSQIWNVLGNVADIIQIRPVQKIGESVFQDFDLKKIYEQYDEYILPIAQACEQRKITCLLPQKENLIKLDETETEDASMEEASYCYVSPHSAWRSDFDFRTQSFESYARKHHLGRILFKKIFRHQRKKVDVSRKMNYTIQ